MISGPRCNLIGQPSMVDEELKLTLKFENCPSRNLPTKLHLEICDSQGNVVFRKRQNIYYVKLQVFNCIFKSNLLQKLNNRIKCFKNNISRKN